MHTDFTELIHSFNLRALRWVLAALALILFTGSPPQGRAAAQYPEPGLNKPASWRGPLRPLPSAALAQAPLADQALWEDDSVTEPWEYVAFQRYVSGQWDCLVTTNLDYPWFYRVAGTPKDEVEPRLNTNRDRLVFASNASGNYDIYTNNLAGSDLRHLTNTKPAEHYPAWSPDGSQIAYQVEMNGDWEIYVMDRYGNDQRPLTADDAADTFPAWSPDGSQIAWVRYGDWGGELWIMNADGSNQHGITAPLPYLGHPSWSPDGSRVAFDADLDGDGWNDLGAALVNGTGWYQISDYAVDMHDLWMGSWSPNGNVLYATLVEYVLYNGNWYIAASSIYRYNFLSGNGLISNSGNYDFYPDVQLTDLYPPQVTRTPLETYQPLSGFYLRWNMYDPGAADLSVQDLEYRLHPDGEWYSITSLFPVDGEYFFSGAANLLLLGQSFDFRVRAQDEASNVSAWGQWPPVTLYKNALRGQTLDNRGLPLRGASATTYPAAMNTVTSGEVGGYAAYLLADGNYTLQASAPGYSAALARSFFVSQDITQTLYLKPTVDYLSNGGFESGWSAWNTPTYPGTLPLEIVPATLLTGENAARLGQTYPPDTFLTNHGDWFDNYNSIIYLIADSQDRLHGLIISPSSEEVFYRSRAPGSTLWSPRVDIPGLNTGEQISPVYRLAVGPQNTAYLAWTNDTQHPDGVYLSEQDANGDWSTAKVLSEGYLSGLGVDPDGRVQIVYMKSENAAIHAYFTERQTNGAWGQPILLSTADARRCGFITGPDGALYFGRIEDQIGVSAVWFFLRTRRPGEDWGEEERYGFIESGPIRLFLAADLQGRLHVVMNQSYARRQPGGEWEYDQQGLAMPPVEISTDQAGNLHALTALEYNISYRLWNPSFGWVNGQSLFSSVLYYDEAHRMAVSPGGAAYLYIRDYDSESNQYLYHHYSSIIASEDSRVEISQQLALPVDLNRPTLAFHYRLEGGAIWDQSALRVAVAGASGTQELFTTTQAADWTFAWADLSPWAGETITLSLAVEQAAGEALIYASLDDLTVGEWLTPLISGIAPQAPSALGPVTLTIHGENFIQTPAVRLGDAPADEVLRQDEHTLLATFNQDITPGLYTLYVDNPGGPGDQTVIWIGSNLFLPLLER